MTRARSIWKLRPVDVMRLDKGKYGDGGGLWLMKDSRIDRALGLPLSASRQGS